MGEVRSATAPVAWQLRGLGYTTVRPIAEDILHRREQTLAAMKALLAHPRPSARQDSARSRRPTLEFGSLCDVRTHG